MRTENTRAERALVLAIGSMTVLAIAGLVIALASVWRAAMPKAFHRGWWLATVIAAAVAGAGLVQRRPWAWFLALGVTVWGPTAMGLQALVVPSLVSGFVYVLYAVATLVLLTRASPALPATPVEARPRDARVTTSHAIPAP
jgi:hypothetical protein